MPEVEDRPREAMPVVAILAAVGGAALGSVSWAFRHADSSGVPRPWSALTAGVLAVLIGVGIGTAVVCARGRGPKMAALTSVLCAASILAGGIGRAYVRLAVFSETPWATQSEYERLERDARRWAKVDPGDERAVAAYMVDRRFIEELDPQLVTEVQVEEFLAGESVPRLLDWHEHPPSFEEWAAGVRQAELERNLERDYGSEDAGALNMVRADFRRMGLWGLVCFALALVLAPGIVLRAQRPSELGSPPAAGSG